MLGHHDPLKRMSRVFTLLVVQLMHEFIEFLSSLRQVHLIDHQNGRLAEQLLFIQLQLLNTNTTKHTLLNYCYNIYYTT